LVNTSHDVTKVKHGRVDKIRLSYGIRVIIKNELTEVGACNNCDHYRFTSNSQAKVLVHEPMPAKVIVLAR
jgi:hypothetical protein